MKTPAGGKVASIFFKDGEFVEKGQPLIQFDIREAAAEKETNLKLIQLERTDLKAKLRILRERQEVITQKVKTSEEITNTIGELVTQGGYQKVQYLQQLDQLYELKSQLASAKMDIVRVKLDSEKSIGQLQRQLKQAELQLQYRNVMAPATGIVFEPRPAQMECWSR